jgi:transposase
MEWDQLGHAEDWILFEENIGESLSIDETSLSQGELYTVVTNKAGRGRKGTLIAMVKGVDSEKVSDVLLRIKSRKRNQVKEITLDMAASMQKIARRCFPNALQVTDRFHVQKLAVEALQELRIKHRWEAIEQENKEIELSKELDKTYVPERLENGDTFKQLLARSRYLLFKHENKWTPSQHKRAEILFKYYPDLKQAYDLCRELSSIYEKTKIKELAYTRLAQWYNKVEKSGFKSFNTIAITIQNNYLTILNYFVNRSTNASAESFNAKIKAFRSQFRGVRNVDFFLYRLSKIYA